MKRWLIALSVTLFIAAGLLAGGPSLPSGVSLASLLALITGNESTVRTTLDVYSKADAVASSAAVASLALKADLHGDAGVNFAGASGTFGTMVTTPIIDTPSAAPLVLRSSGTPVMTLDDTEKVCADTYRSAVGASDAVLLGASGIVSMPNQSYVYTPNENTFILPDAATTVATWSAETTDRHGEFDPATGIFTAGTAGVFSACLIAQFAADGDGTRRVEINFNNQTHASNHIESPPAGAAITVSTMGIGYLSAGQTIVPYLFQSGGAAMTMGGLRLIITKLH